MTGWIEANPALALLIAIPFDDIITASGNDDIANDKFSVTSPEIYR